MRPNDLFYNKRGLWIPLPQWSQFFLELGYAIGSREDSESRILAGLALPTRAYAAVLVATGVIVGRLSHPNRDENALTRFHQLSELAIGTSLYYRRQHGKRIKVLFDGLTQDDSMIRLRAGGEMYEIPPSLARQIEFPSKEFDYLPGSSYGRSNNTLTPFLSYFLDVAAAKEFITQSRLDCIMIGSVGRIEREINDVQFAVQDSKGGFLDGALQDIVRVRKFCVNAKTYRSDIFYTYSKEPPNLQQEIPEVVLFDGANSFLNWGASYHYPHCIVLLAQTDPEFDAAVQVFNENFMKNHLDDVVFKQALKIPKGISISIYQEMRK